MIRIGRFAGLLFWKAIITPIIGLIALPLLAVAWLLLGAIYGLMLVWRESA